MTKRSKSQNYFEQHEEKPLPRKCEFGQCHHAGEYPAPRDKQNLRNYRWFCLEHIREYNQNWDYYAGLSPDQMENVRRFETVWERPSWPFGNSSRKTQGAFQTAWHDFMETFGIFEETDQGSNYKSKHRPMNYQQHETLRAMATLGLQPPMGFDAIKMHYKKLVKLYHPDANGGNQESEEKFKTINEAFQTIKKAFGA